MRRLRCLPTLVQANKRDTKGYPGFSVENDMLRVNGLVLGGGLPIFVLIFAEQTLHYGERDPTF